MYVFMIGSAIIGLIVFLIAGSQFHVYNISDTIKGLLLFAFWVPGSFFVTPFIYYGLSILIVMFGIIGFVIGAYLITFLYAILLTFTMTFSENIDFKYAFERTIVKGWVKKCWLGTKFIPVIAIWWFISAAIIYGLKDSTAIPTNIVMRWYYYNVFYFD